MSVLSREERFYASKPAACGSVICEQRNGKTVRVHDGTYIGFTEVYPPSTYTTDLEEIRLSHTFDKHTLGEEI